jgi:hypothetical protein
VKASNWRFVAYQVGFASVIYLLGSTMWLFLFIWGGESVSGALVRLMGLSIGSLLTSAINVLRPL